MDEKPMPEKLLKNPIFLKLQNEVKLCNFTDEVFNAEVCNMTDLKYEHECGYIEGREEGRVEGRADERKKVAAKLAANKAALAAKDAENRKLKAQLKVLLAKKN